MGSDLNMVKRKKSVKKSKKTDKKGKIFIVVTVLLFVAAAFVLLSEKRRGLRPDADIERLNREVEKALVEAGLGPGHIESGEETVRRDGLAEWIGRERVYRVDDRELMRATLSLARLEDAENGVRLESRDKPDGSNHTVVIYSGARKIWLLRFLPGAGSFVAGVETTPLVTIIIDDIGSEWRYTPKLLEIDGNLTFSVLPYGGYCDRAKAMIAEKGFESMAHLPMEPKKYTSKNYLGPGKFWTGMDLKRVERVLLENLEAVPDAVGANNHMGSKFTAWKPGMKIVLEGLKKRNLYFVDSVTGGHKISFELARDMGMRCYARDVFLDTYASSKSVEKQLKRLIGIARKKGKALAIGHPRKGTLDVLKRKVPKLYEEYGVKLVPASEMVEVYAPPDPE